MPVNNSSDLKVDFNFDNWERETEIKPFTIVIGGKPYQAIDPFDLDYRAFEELMEDADIDGQFEMLFPKDHEKIRSAKLIKMGAIKAFSEAAAKHYGLDPTAA